MKRILTSACGWGTHLLGLAARGYGSLVGVEMRCFKRRHYTVEELTGLFEWAGLRVECVYGSFGLESCRLEAPRTVLKAFKEEAHA